MEMPTPCQHCGEWFDLDDGYGSEKWYPNTVICKQCYEEEEQQIELEDRLKELKEELEDLESQMDRVKSDILGVEEDLKIYQNVSNRHNNY